MFFFTISRTQSKLILNSWSSCLGLLKCWVYKHVLQCLPLTFTFCIVCNILWYVRHVANRSLLLEYLRWFSFSLLGSFDSFFISWVSSFVSDVWGWDHRVRVGLYAGVSMWAVMLYWADLSLSRASRGFPVWRERTLDCLLASSFFFFKYIYIYIINK